MKAAGLAAAGAILLAAAPAMADPWGLTGSPTACAALESLVVFGLIDGGLGGDTTEFSGIVAAGDGQRCLAWLDGYGYGDGMRLGACRDTFDTLNTRGLPTGFDRDDAEVIRDLLTAQDKSECDRLAAGISSGN